MTRKINSVTYFFNCFFLPTYTLGFIIRGFSERIKSYDTLYPFQQKNQLCDDESEKIIHKISGPTIFLLIQNSEHPKLRGNPCSGIDLESNSVPFPIHFKVGSKIPLHVPTCAHKSFPIPLPFQILLINSDFALRIQKTAKFGNGIGTEVK